MPTHYNGFRIWNLEFQAMADGAPGVTKELDSSNNPTGRLLSNDSKYYTEDDIGLACHLRDFLYPMTDPAENGVGWSLDTDLYSYLYNLVQSGDETYTTFINDNHNIYDSTLNPTGETTVKLAKSSYVRAMFFKHTLGYKAMIGLSLYAMDEGSRISSFYESSSKSLKEDPGFNRYHIFKSYQYGDSYSIQLCGGMFISVIPPRSQSDPDYRFYAEKDITDSGFFPPTATPVVPMMHTAYYYSNNANYVGCSWLKLGTSTAYDAGSNSGVVAGTNMKLSLLLDSKGCVGVSYKYTANSNTTYLNPIILIGPFYKTKINESDSLSTSKLCILTRNINTNYDASNSSIYNYKNAAWISCSSSTYCTNYYTGYDSDTKRYVHSFSEDASSLLSSSIYTAYPALDSSVYLSYRYAKSGYTTLGFIDNDIIVWTNNSGLVPGQTYNDGQWCYIGATDNDFIPANNNPNSTDSTLYASIRWDSVFNGTKTFS